jgi:hypothetical protein
VSLVFPRTILAAASAVLLAGACSSAAPPSTSPGASVSSGAPASTASAGQVAGRVTYADGRPLPGAHVLVIGVEYATELDLQSNANGTYGGAIEQKDANYRMAAWVEAPFEGATYRFPLEPVGTPDTHFLGADGFAKDFAWRLTGRGSWAGQLQADDRRGLIGGIAGVFVYDPLSDPTAAAALALPVGSTIDVTLTPTTPLVDGSQAQPLTATVTITEATGPSTIGEVGALTDVPLGRYRATATVTEPGGSPRPLLLGVTCSRSGCPLKPAALSDTAEMLFPPADPLVHSRPYQRQPVAGLALYVTLP